jgi:ERO1-like protein beta
MGTLLQNKTLPGQMTNCCKGPNLECFKYRVWNNPQWIENLYFNYVVVLRALTKVANYLEDYSYCSGDPDQDDFTRDKVHKLISTAQIAAPSFDESRMFDPNDPTIRGLKAEFRQRFRNVSRIMDCVGCDKCRLWGKLQTGGYGTALKVLFEFDPDNPDAFSLRRTEVVSLVVTLQRLSHSIWAVEQFRKMILDGSTVETMSTIQRVIMYFRMAEFKPFGVALSEELGQFMEALKFVLKSYVLLPVNLWKMGIMYISQIWDHYVVGGSAIGRVRLDL